MRKQMRLIQFIALLVGTMLLGGVQTTAQPGRGPSDGQSHNRSSGGGGSSGRSDARSAQSLVVAVADERTNTLIISAPEDAMALIEELIAEIDTVAEELTEIRVFPLKFADAEEMSELIVDVFTEGGTQSSRGGRSSSSFGSPGHFFGGFGGGGFRPGGSSGGERRLQEQQVTAAADVRTNSVIVTASSETMGNVEQMIEGLDSDPAQEQKVFVYSLENANVEEIQDILNGVFGGSSRSRSSGGSSYDRSRYSSGGSSSNYNRGGSSSSRGGSSFGGSSSGRR